MKKSRVQQAAEPELSVVLGGAPAVEPDPRDIATAAYLAWERDGRPEGRDLHYWAEAETRLRAAGGGTAAAGKNVRAA